MQFFDLSTEAKMSCAHVGGPRPVRGFNSGSQQKSSKLYPGNEGLLDAKDALVCRLISKTPLKYSLNDRYRNRYILDLFMTSNTQTNGLPKNFCPPSDTISKPTTPLSKRPRTFSLRPSSSVSISLQVPCCHAPSPTSASFV